MNNVENNILNFNRGRKPSLQLKLTAENGITTTT